MVLCGTVHRILAEELCNDIVDGKNKSLFTELKFLRFTNKNYPHQLADISFIIAIFLTSIIIGH